MVLNNVWKYICGWINYSGKVINRKMIEKEMDYRGFKSIADSPTSQTSVIVKEQRVDGSCTKE